jgi:hypothetical protein
MPQTHLEAVDASVDIDGICAEDGEHAHVELVEHPELDDAPKNGPERPWNGCVFSLSTRRDISPRKYLSLGSGVWVSGFLGTGSLGFWVSGFLGTGRRLTRGGLAG